MERNVLSRPVGAVLNLEAALSRMGNSRRLLCDIARYFVEDAPRLAGLLELAIDQCDSDEAARYAHTLKSMAANLDARPTAQVALRMERAGREGELESMRHYLHELLEDIDVVIAELRSELQL